jgi:D-aspartate ligase
MSISDKNIEKVLILEAGAKAAIPIIESCGQMGLYVIAASSKKGCGFYSKFTKQKLIYPSPGLYPQKCVDFLLNFLKEQDVSVLFPVGDLMTDLIAKNQKLFSEHTKFILPPYEIFVQGRDKILTLKAAVKAGCPIPQTWYPHEQGLEAVAEVCCYPNLIKPAISVGSRGLVLCKTKQQLLDNFEKNQKNYDRCFVQEFVPQTGLQYKVDAIFDQFQNLLAGVVYAKLRYYPADGGSSVLNKTEKRPDILASALKVMKELKWLGFCDFDFITDPRDGIVKLMEINPRYPESYRATVAAGVDMTKIIYQLAKGQNPQPQLDYLENRYTRFLFGDIMWFLTTKQNRWTAKPSFFSFFRKDMNYQLLRANDFGPIYGYIISNLSMFWDKEYREFRLRLKNKKDES